MPEENDRPSSPEHEVTSPAREITSPAANESSDEDLIVASKPDLSVSSRLPPSITAPNLSSPSPRTPNRVRFALDEEIAGDAIELDDTRTRRFRAREDRSWADEEDYLQSDSDDDADGSDDDRLGGGTRAPLLTGIEAPSVTVAQDIDELLERNARPKSGMRMAFMNMANSIIGAGIIGQPYAFRQAGLGAGLFLLVVLTIAIDWTINLIVINSKLSGADSFQETVKKCFGKPGLIAISIAQWAFAFGGMIAFCIIIGDTLPHVFAALFPALVDIPVLRLLTQRQPVIMIFTLGVSYPLTLYRDISKLAKASALALVSMVIIVITVVTQGFRVPAEDRGQFSLPLLTINSGIFQAIGVISFAFVCHHNSLLIYGSLQKPTIDRFATVTHFSTGVSMVMCIIMASAGFLTFRDKTAGNVLNNFPSDNTMVNVARFCFGLNMLSTLPLEAFVCREVMENYFFPGEAFNQARHLIFSSALVFTAMILSLVTCDLGAVFELIGATSACALAYILPPLCYIKLSTRSWKTYAAMATVVFGVLVLIISLVQAFVKMASGGGEVSTCA